ncbi:MAG: hypothetical protein IPN84_05175 [Sphingomonadales bacterium]|nr:hypothetical protein [Sphingomonadales bacterium]
MHLFARLIRQPLIWIAMALPAPAHADALVVAGYFSAPRPETMALRSLAIDRIEGSEGSSMALTLEEALGDISVNNQPWFRILSRRAGGQPDGLISGRAHAAVDERAISQQRAVCVEESQSGQCLRKEEQAVSCTRRILNVTITLRIADTRDGRLVYSHSKPKREEVTLCPEDEARDTEEEIVFRMIKAAADAVRQDLSPIYARQKIKLPEKRLVLPPEQDGRYRTALKMAKSSPHLACQQFRILNAEAPSEAAFLYAVGLCAEQEGNLNAALNLYQSSQLLTHPDLIRAALSRVQGRIAMQEAMDARQR